MKPKKADRQAAGFAAMKLLERMGISEPPIDPVAIAELLGIDVRGDTRLGNSLSGCLMLKNEKFGILYNTFIENRGFQRFTIGHELGHHQLQEHHSTLFANGERHISTSNFSSVDWQEVEADFFAASLLMPTHLFKAETNKCELGIPAVVQLSETFLTSLTSTAIRYAQLTPDPVAVIVSEGRHIAYCFTSESLGDIRGVFLRKGTQVPRGVPTAKFNSDPNRVGDSERSEGCSMLSDWFVDVTHDFEVNEDVVGLGSYGKTLTVLHADSIPEPEELDDYRNS